MFKASKNHLLEVNETYFEHQGVAFRYSWRCLQAAVKAFIHGLIPGCFITGASDIVKDLDSNRKAPK